jgi:hypothetical protein
VLREFLFGDKLAGFVATAKSVGKRLQAHLDEPVRHGGRTLVLRGDPDRDGVIIYSVEDVTDTGNSEDVTETGHNAQTNVSMKLQGEPGGGTVASVKFVITRRDKEQLRARGFTDAEIAELKPEDVSKILAQQRETPPTASAGQKERPQDVMFGSPLDYCGPVVQVPDLGPDDLNEHGMPKSQDKP